MTDRSWTCAAISPQEARGHRAIKEQSFFGRMYCARWRILAVMTVLTSALLHGYMAMTAVGPSFPFDEITLFQYAKFLSGTGMTVPVQGAGYFPLWSVALAPIWWITSDPATFYHIAIWLGVAVGILTIWPLTRLVQCFGLSLPQSLAVAALVMCMPSRTVQAAYTMSEKLLMLLLVCIALTIYRLWERATYGRMAVLALLVALAIGTHERAIVVLPVTLLWLMFQIRRNRWVMLGGIVVTTILSLFAYRLAMQLNVTLLAQPFGQGSGLLNNLHSAPGIFVAALLGQAWYQVVSTLGVVVLGFVALTVMMVRDWRNRKTLDVAAWMLGIFAAQAMLSVVYWSDPNWLFGGGWVRIDVWIYGRYIDPFTALLVAVGLAVIVKGMSVKYLFGLVGIGLLIILPTIYWLAPRARTWGFITPAHVPGILPWSGTLPSPEQHWTWLTPTFGNANRFWIIASVTAVLFWGFLALACKQPVLIVSVLLAACCVGAIMSYSEVEKFQREQGGVPPIVRVAREISSKFHVSAISMDMRCKANGIEIPAAQNDFSFWFQSNLKLAYTPSEINTELVIGCPDFSKSTLPGALKIGKAEWKGYYLWVSPGNLQGELKAAGILP